MEARDAKAERLPLLASRATLTRVAADARPAFVVRLERPSEAPNVADRRQVPDPFPASSGCEDAGRGGPAFESRRARHFPKISRASIATKSLGEHTSKKVTSTANVRHISRIRFAEYFRVLKDRQSRSVLRGCPESPPFTREGVDDTPREKPTGRPPCNVKCGGGANGRISKRCHEVRQAPCRSCSWTSQGF